MRNVGGWMFFVSIVLLFLALCLFYVTLFPRIGSFLTLALGADVSLAAICVGIPGAVLWIVGWIVDEIAKKAR
jgi:hypothetical protein